MISTETPAEDGRQQPDAEQAGVPFPDPHGEHSTSDNAGTGAAKLAAGAPTLTKAELSHVLFEQLGLNKREAKEFVEAFFELLHDGLVTTGEIKLRDFGHFTVHRKAPRPGRNPRTGESAPIEARYVVRFRASPTLKSAVQSDRPTPLDAEE